jgi:hypothetical protein
MMPLVLSELVGTKQPSAGPRDLNVYEPRHRRPELRTAA